MTEVSEFDWALHIFLSADIINSTEYKQTDKTGWRDLFQAFYMDFPGYIQRKVQRADEEIRVWKYVGDEILLYASISHLSDALDIAKAFHAALGDYSKELETKTDDRLSLKGTAWVAGFPVTNAIIRRPGLQSCVVDFLGPGIDTGFRLAKFAEKEKLIINVELAYLILQQRKEARVHDFPSLHCDGGQPLKGVNSGRPYPLFWINSGSPSPSRRIDSIRIRPFTDIELLDVCEEYFSEIIDSSRPFIVTGESCIFGEILSRSDKTSWLLQNKKKDYTPRLEPKKTTP